MQSRAHLTIVLGIALSAVFSAQPLKGQVIPEWMVHAKPSMRVGSEIDLDGVRGAVALRGGAIAIADGRNARVVVVDPQGRLLRTLGRKGNGPGEFQYLASLFAVGDTLLAYDPGLNRVTVWSTNGRMIKTIPIPGVRGAAGTEVRAMLSPQTFVVTTRGLSPRRNGGLFRDSVNLLVFDVGKRSYTSLGRREWQYQYFYGQAGGYTVYRTPFLPSAFLVGSSGRLVFMPMDSAKIDVLDISNRKSVTTRIPMDRRPFDRSIVTNYRDSLLETRGIDPPSAARIRDLFDSNFPSPAFSPRVLDVVTVGDKIWLLGASLQRATGNTWYVADPVAGRVVASVLLPKTIRLLGGTSSAIIVLERDELDVEHVAVYPISPK